MSKKKIIFLLSTLTLVGLSGCSLKETFNSVKNWFGEMIEKPTNENKDENEPEKPVNPGDGDEGGETDLRPDYEKGDKKAEDGVGLMFSETIGYNTKDASIFQEDENTRYVVYASNETSKGQQVFAARKATKVEGAWKYEEKHVVFRGATEDNAWDKYIFQPSVIKGEFLLGETSYSYLMAYQGNEDGSSYNNHIGLAVTNNILGEWTRVGNEPLIENPELYESSFGFGSPELVSFDEHGKAYLFYSFGETTLSGTRIKTADFSNLNDIHLEIGYSELPVAGLIGRDDNITSNAGFAIGSDNKLYYAGDGMPDSNQPGCATSFEIAKADLDITQRFDKEWTSIERVTGLDTMDEEKLGWDELYSPTFVRDAFGRIDVSNAKIEVVYSTYDVDASDAGYTGQLCLHEVNL